ncbi:glycosyltransferase family 4 protein [Halovenus rubra]|uniref:Glycosyltransferase family 4 protein n=2 Tax=Halovenus rubra TaxID=869890 RepID=A0ACC7DYH6_9EURY|nr:glycosyltransferase family 4 protein [Halovenus rubra]
MTSEIDDVCIVTQPGGDHEEKSHERDLARILSELTSIVVLTANIGDESPLRAEQDVIEYSSRSAGGHIITELVQFVLNQLRLCRSLVAREERIVLFFGTTSYLLPIIVARLVGKQVVLLPRGDVALSVQLRWERQLPDQLARFLAQCVSTLEEAGYRTAHAIITYTPSMAETLGADQYDDKLYPHGARFIDTDEFAVQTPFEDRGRTVGFVGRLDVEKQIPVLVEMVKHLPDDIRIVFVGDGEYRTYLEEELSEEISAGKVEVPGWVSHDEVSNQYNRFRLLLLPSAETEGLPTTVLEGMACGTPSYATPVSGVPDVVHNEETGFIMHQVDSTVLADEVTAILESEEIDDISRAARELIETEYSFKAAVSRYENILQEISLK